MITYIQRMIGYCIRQQGGDNIEQEIGDKGYLNVIALRRVSPELYLS